MEFYVYFYSLCSKEELDKAPVDWVLENTVHTMAYAVAIYGFFVVSSKSQIIPNMALYFLLFLVYFIDSYRNYL